MGYGVVVGGTSGSGVILLSLLMAAGLEGAGVIATDAVISVATSIIKISVFGLAGVVTAQVLALALLIGGIALPGAFLARAFVERMPVHIHTAILDVAVIAGGLVMISSALRSFFGYARPRRRDIGAAVHASAASYCESLSSSLFAFFSSSSSFIRNFDFRRFQHGHRKRFAKQVAFSRPSRRTGWLSPFTSATVIG